MPLPPLQSDGSLPPGRHQITTVNDVFASFPVTSARRQALNAALAKFVESVKRLSLGTAIVIGGSYITGKAEPEDIDVALLTTGLGETATLQKLSADGVDLVALDIVALDVFVETTSANFERWVQFFMADRTGIARGVVVIAIQ